MNKYFFLLILLISQCLTAQYSKNYSKYKYCFDESGKLLDLNTFLDKWRDKENDLYRWDYVSKDSGRISKLYSGNYTLLEKLNNDEIVNYINKSFKKNINNTYTIVIEYYFLNDLCISDNKGFKLNNYDAIEMKKRFYNYKEIKNKQIIKNNNHIYLVVLEKGNTLINNTNSEDEFIFIDEENYFKNNFLNENVLCGSFLIIKPDNNGLIGRGENNIMYLDNYLSKKIWEKLFPPIPTK